MRVLASFTSAAMVIALVLVTTQMAHAADAHWPQEITGEDGTIVVYQPQPESLEGNVLKARAAMSLEMKDAKEPIFGAFWFEANIDTDREAGTVTIRDVKVTDVRWPESKDADEQRFTAIIEARVPEAGFDISLERLSASLEVAEVERASLEGLKNDAPIIIFREELAVLLMYDGEPRYSEVENSPYERVLNTPFAVVRHTKNKTMYMTSGDFWYTAKDPMGPWRLDSSPPADLVKMIPKPESEGPPPTKAPAVVAADEPTELIVTDGKPAWTSLTGGQLLYVQNTESPWLRDLDTNNMYLLLSGRWFRSKASDGPWVFVRADELPESFANIPPDSDIGGLRASIADTDEAKDAMLDAQIPQTAAIKRSEAKLTVEYDGTPDFKSIDGTKVAYAVNTGGQVLRIDNHYYAVDNGVWFESSDPKGPWVVADDVPSDEIAKIPPSEPVYNVTHVHVYQSTPEVVYVGYTPGYLWSFPYYGVPVYGTGWYYPPYYGSYYYPRPPTWGLHVGYNPWTGWNFGVSWSNGFMSVGIGWSGGYGGAYRPWGCCGGFYGGGFRGPTIINTGDINIGNNVNIGNHNNIGNKVGNQVGNRVGNGSRNPATSNLYNRTGNKARNAAPSIAGSNLNKAMPANSRANNVYTDRNGNVARRSNDKWQSRENGQWSDRTTSSRPVSSRQSSTNRSTTQNRATPSRSSSLNQSGLNRSYQSRQRGTSRARARPSMGRRR